MLRLRSLGSGSTGNATVIEAGHLRRRRLLVDCALGPRVLKERLAAAGLTLADMDGNETFDAYNLGSAEEVVEESVADNDMVMIRGPKNTRAVTGEAAFAAFAVSA